MILHSRSSCVRSLGFSLVPSGLLHVEKMVLYSVVELWVPQGFASSLGSSQILYFSQHQDWVESISSVRGLIK